jgi:hypothetical protein
LQAFDVGAFDVVSFLVASRGFSSSATLLCSYYLAMVVFQVASLVVLDINILVWLLELVVLASCGVLGCFSCRVASCVIFLTKFIC